MNATTPPAISVIVPVYNVAAHVGAAIASLQAQTWTDFEALVIDDGSTDGSGERAAEAFGDDPRFRLIRQENRGLSGARNTGLDAACGALIAFLDSDDRYAPDYLARLQDALEQTGACWVACAVRSCFADGTSDVHSAIHGAANLAAHPAMRRHPLTDWSQVIRHFPSAWNKLYRRALIEGLRFDEGTWFEDHTFFLSAAARTDHILHLPEPLYLQTRGRDGQITASDDDRVFEQFGVLREMRACMEKGGKPGAETGFARIASRLVFERSTALIDPGRRARFAADAARFLEAEAGGFTPAWDGDIARAWGLEMAGELPLSVVLPWDGAGEAALCATLDSLARLSGPGREVLLCCARSDVDRARTLAVACPGTQVHDAPKPRLGALLALGRAKARGRYVAFLMAGDTLHPAGYQDMVEVMLATGADHGLCQFRQDTGAGPVPHNGFDDMTALPSGTPTTGTLDVTPRMALAMAPDLSARVFSRAFLETRAPAFTRGAHPGWALGLAAPLVATGNAYLGWGPLALDLAPGSARARALPTTAQALARGTDAAARALPQEILARLPEGWQRRLFARALRQQVDLGQPGRGFLAGAMLAAMTRRLTGASVGPAGFDPAFGPRLARLMNPAGLIGGAPLLPQGPALASAGNSADNAAAASRTGASVLTFAFPLATRGLFRFRADFHTDAYANLSFVARDGVRLPFHLSLRFAEGLAVANDSRADGAWRAERQVPLALPRDGVEVTIEIAPPRVRVEVDGQQVFDLGRRSPLNRGGLAGLDEIATLDLQGGIRPLDMMPAPPGNALTLDPRLQLRAARDPAETTLRIAHSGAVLPVTPAPGPGDSPALVADLPGRHWQGLDAEAPLEITDAAGQTLLRLTRARMADRIAALMAHPPGLADAALVLLCLDHLRHGALHAHLPAPALATLRDLAEGFDLAGYIAPETTDGAGAVPAPAADTDGPLIDAALARFHQSQQADPAPDPLTVVRELALPPSARRGLFLALTDVFCREGADFEGLFAHAQDIGLVDEITEAPLPGDVWSRSALLPYLMRAGRYGAVKEILQGLAQPGPGWILTPPLAWVMRYALAAPDLPEAEREPMLYAVMHCIANRAPDYWGRAHCVELTGAAVTLLTDHRRDDAFARDVERLCLQAYGLSRRFWALLDARTPEGRPLSPALAAARADFALLETGTPDEIDRALHTFERAGCADAPRIRRERLGPSGLPGLPTAARLARRTEDAGEAALRHMACPGTAPVGAEVSDLAAAALPGFYPEVPRAPYFGLQVKSARRVRALLDDPGATGELPALLSDLARLARPGSCFLGLGLALVLVPALAGEEAETLADWVLARWHAFSDDERARAAQAPALRGPLTRLRACDSAAARRLRTALPDMAEQTPDTSDLPGGSPLHDTLVVVFSCKPYLETRIPALRAGWLSLLETLDIPYVVVVGDGDGRRIGDIVHLDAPDDYEGLPQKTLAAIRWVHDKTSFAHMLKIDDDCFLNAPLFFDALSYRKFDYYGRKLTRGTGQMDRAWHQAKSASARGRYELDRSPEPSFYADGGSGYALSRRAMGAALKAADRPAGQRLIQLSFMEDKMLGDLLALEGIQVADEDYRVSIRRRTHSGAIPVAAWLNAFTPSRTAPLQLIHLDTHEDQQETLKRLDRPGLWPKKIWPGFQGVKLGYQSNALELVSPPETVDRAREAGIAVVAAMRNEMFMLPHFLAHYRRLGVDSFLVADNASDDGSREYLAAQPDVALFSVDTDYRLSHYGVAWQQALMSAFRPGKWSLVADADELLVWQKDQRQTLPELLATPAFEEAEAARIFMLDMYPEGPLEKATFETGDPFAEAGFTDAVPFLENTPARGPYSDAPTWTSALRHRLIPGSRGTLFVAQKLALLRYHPFMRLSDGLHYVSDAAIAPRELLFAHFKYNAAFRDKAATEVTRRQHFNDAEEYRKYMALASEGRSVIHDPEISVPWTDSAFVRERLD